MAQTACVRVYKYVYRFRSPPKAFATLGIRLQSPFSLLPTTRPVTIKKGLADFLPIQVIFLNARQRGTMLDGTIRNKLGTLLAVVVNLSTERLSTVVLVWFGVGVLFNLGVHLSGIPCDVLVGTQWHGVRLGKLQNSEYTYYM